MSLFRPKSSRYAALFRWDEVFLVPASPAGGLGMKLVSNALASANRTSIALKNPGDTLWIDNWRMLHGRSAVAAMETDRIIHRIYFGEVF